MRARDAEAEVWHAWVGDHVADVDRFAQHLLSDDETARLGSYRSRAAAERYVVTRSLVRAVLGSRLGVSGRDLHVQRTDTGKPVVAQGLHFNVSHSGDLIVLAVSDQRAVGVDIERRREVARVDALVERWLSAAERGDLALLRQRGVEPSDAFLRIWSLKEARLKALGVGIVGASRAALERVDSATLDELLDALAGRSGDGGYVGAVAFA